MRTFEYLKPASLDEALAMLDQYGDKAKLVAGGTDVMVQWKKKTIHAEYMISLRNVPELHYIEYDGGLKIGGATTHRTLEMSDVIRDHFPIITDAVTNLGSVQVRNSGTIGGNICNAAPSADTAPPLLALEAEAHIAGSQGRRSVPLTDFFTGPSRTVLSSGEILTHFMIPKPAPRTGMAYWKLTRRKAMDLPILGVALVISFEDDLTTCSKAKIALGVAAPTPMRALKAEAFLEGKRIDGPVLEEAGNIASQEATPRTTIRGSEWYRREIIGVLVRRTGAICMERAKGAA